VPRRAPNDNDRFTIVYEPWAPFGALGKWADRQQMSAISFIRNQAKKYLARRRYSPESFGELTYLADKFGSDKGRRFSAHLYTRVYSRLFEEIRNDPITILEIGLHRAEADKRRPRGAAEGVTSESATQAPSLEMWRVYFPNARLFGFDIDDFSQVVIDGCKIIRGDMSSRSDLEKAIRVVGEPIDIIIDDGSHVSHHQQIALGALFPHVRSGGLYIIEDLHWQDQKLENCSAPKTRDFLRKLQAIRICESPFLSDREQEFICQNVDTVRLFDSLTDQFPANYDVSDALAVLRKK
jgi:hypothetical protein